MTRFLVQNSVSHRLDEIYRYTLDRWGKTQADSYIQGLFEAFGKIESHEVLSPPIPAEFGVEGFYFIHKKHYIYWKYLPDGVVGIVTILHERMHQMRRFKEDFPK